MIVKYSAVWLVLMSLPLGGALAADAPPGASACSGCHPASRSIETPANRLIGRTPADIVTAVQAFRSGQRPAKPAAAASENAKARAMAEPIWS